MPTVAFGSTPILPVRSSPSLRPSGPGQIDDYSHLSPAYRKVVQDYANSLLAGLPVCGELVAPPHFVPRVDGTHCIYCSRCATAWPAQAIAVDTEARLHRHLVEQCIGCGLCAVNCGRQGVIRMEPVLNYRQPPESLLSALARLGPDYLCNAWLVWKKYR